MTFETHPIRVGLQKEDDEIYIDNSWVVVVPSELYRNIILQVDDETLAALAELPIAQKLVYEIKREL